MCVISIYIGHVGALRVAEAALVTGYALHDFTLCLSEQMLRPAGVLAGLSRCCKCRYASHVVHESALGHAPFG